jgi:hypothetical protein
LWNCIIKKSQRSATYPQELREIHIGITEVPELKKATFRTHKYQISHKREINLFHESKTIDFLESVSKIIKILY